MTDTHVHVRWLVRRDLPAVLAIDSASMVRPWDDRRFLRVLLDRKCIGMVAEGPWAGDGCPVLGFYLYRLHGTRIEILRMAVHPGVRRAGVGRAMAAKLIGKLKRPGRTRVDVLVPGGSLDAQLFFRSMGFVAEGVEPDGDDDGYRMAYQI